MWMENTTSEFERYVSDEAFFIKPRYESCARGLSNRADRYKMLSSARGEGETSQWNRLKVIFGIASSACDEMKSKRCSHNLQSNH